MENEKKRAWFKLTIAKIRILFCYYIVLFHVGLVLCLYTFFNDCFIFKFSISQLALIGSIGTSILGCSIFYLRKLYKSCIGADIEIVDASKTDSQVMGVYFYFLLRPLFSVAFALLIFVSIKSGMYVITNPKNENELLDTGFIFFTMVVSFFGGFGAGDFLNILEDKTNKVLNRITFDK